MKDAFGGILSLAIIVVFLVIVMGVLGLTVSYTKAFKMKNNVITRIEQYEGFGCFIPSGTCYQRILEDAKSIGYSPVVQLNCATGYINVSNYFCFKQASEEIIEKNDIKYTHYDVSTQVDINIPIINKIMGMEFFQVSGSTRNVEFHNYEVVG